MMYGTPGGIVSKGCGAVRYLYWLIGFGPLG
jgi:hypothetical protein